MQTTRTLLALGASLHGNQTHLLIFARHFSKKQLSPSIAFLSNSEQDSFMKKKGAFKPSSSKKLSLAEYGNPEGRPLSILLCWLMSKPRAVQKYAQFYLDQGFDVLTVRISPWQLLWPASYTPIVNQELLPVLHSAPHSKKLIHGFSVGGYVFSQLLKHIGDAPDAEAEKVARLARSIQAQIWDSVVDVNGVSVGVSKSVFLKPGFAQKALQSYIEGHMRVFHGVATRYYEEAHENFYWRPLNSPALFLASRIDPISTLDVIQAVKAAWEGAGIKCEGQVWDNTAHVGHMHRYPEEYKQAIRSFLGKVDWKSDGGQRAPAPAPSKEPTRAPAPGLIMPQPAFAYAVASPSGHAMRL